MRAFMMACLMVIGMAVPAVVQAETISGGGLTLTVDDAARVAGLTVSGARCSAPARWWSWRT